MKKRYINFLFTVLGLISSLSYSMENSSAQDLQENSTVTIYDHEFLIPKEQLKTIGFFVHLYDFASEALADPKAPLDLTYFNLLLEYDRNPNGNLEKEQIVPLFNLANFFGFRNETLRRLTYEGKRIPKKERPRYMRQKTYLNSVGYLINQAILSSTNNYGVTTNLNEDRSEHNTLDLSHRNLDNLNALERLASIVSKPIHEIILDHNMIHTIDCAHIMKIFPRLIKISAQHNTIKYIKNIQALPKRFELDLSHSTLKNCHSFKAQEDVKITIKGTKLRSEVKEALLDSVQPTLFQIHRHRFKALYDAFSDRSVYYSVLFYTPFYYFVLKSGYRREHGWTSYWLKYSQELLSRIESVLADAVISNKTEQIETLIKLKQKCLSAIKNDQEKLSSLQQPSWSSAIKISCAIGLGLGLYSYWRYTYANNIQHKYKQAQIIENEKN